MVKQRDYKVTEVAEYLSLSTNTVYKMVRTGEIRAYRLGGQWRITRDAIDELRTKRSNRHVP